MERKKWSYYDGFSDRLYVLVPDVCLMEHEEIEPVICIGPIAGIEIGAVIICNRDIWGFL
jgi:hypothetical protein